MDVAPGHGSDRRSFKLLAVGLGLVAGIVICEVGLRLFSVGPAPFVFEGIRLSPDPELVYELAPGAAVVEDGLPVSSAGLRDREYSTTKPPDTFRIAIVGDSVAYGYHVRQPDTMSKSLERLLAESRIGGASRYEVLNFGVNGYNTRQIARRIETAVARFNPDLVVYLYCLNDPDGLDNDIKPLLAPLNAGDRRLFESAVRHAESAFSGLRAYRLLMTAVDSLTRAHSSGLPTVRSPMDTPDYYLGVHADGPRWERARRDFQRMGLAVGSLPARWVAAVSPYLWKSADARRAQFEPRLRATTLKVADALRTSGASVLDLSQPVDRFSRATGTFLGIDQVHYSPVGNEFVAVAVLDHLLRESLLPGVTLRGVAELDLVGSDLAPMIRAAR